MKAAFASPEGQATLGDLANFGDPSRVTSFPVDVRNIV